MRVNSGRRYMVAAPLAIAALGAFAGHPARGETQRCLRPGDTVLFKTKTIVVVGTARGARPFESVAYYGCVRGRGKRIRLDRRRHENYYEAFKPAGYFVVSAAYHSDDRVTVTMTNVRSGAFYRIARRTSLGGRGRVLALALKANGSLAMLSDVNVDTARLEACEISTCYDKTLRAARRVALDQGAIPSSSFRLRGSTLSWTSGGTARSAELR